jgi:putative NIF3 family GTP cyclohydrolase 1 type 2
VATTLADVLAVSERLWPGAGAEEWDSVGLVSGNPASPVSSVLLAVDAVLDTVDEAVSSHADVLLTHHPLLLRGVTTVAEDRYKGAVLATLSERLGLTGLRPLVAGDTPERGIGRVGTLPAPTTLGRLARQLADILPPTAGGIRASGHYDAPISTVAVCAGAGDSLLGLPAVLAANVYITSDLRHHPASEFRENATIGGGPALLDVSHWASEWLWLDIAAEQLRAALPGVTVTVSELRTDPWDFLVVQ